MHLPLGLVLGTTVVVLFLIKAALLYGISRLFRLSTATFINALKLTAIFEVIGAAGLFPILILIAFPFIFYLTKRVYQLNWKMTVAFCLVYLLSSSVVSGVINPTIRTHLFSPLYLVGESMAPTMGSNSLIIINRQSGTYQRGDIVAYELSAEGETITYVQRIVGMPGEVLEIKDKQVLINGEPLAETYLPAGTDTEIATLNDASAPSRFALSDEEYFILGDNRPVAKDSRNDGPISGDQLRGKYGFTLWAR